VTDQSLQDRARQLLDENAKRGEGYYYTAPSRTKYPHQWSWDSSFHAIVNCRLGRANLAKEEVLTLLAKMLPDGTLPHIVSHEGRVNSMPLRLFRSYWPQPDRSPLIQPPVVALAVRETWQCSEDIAFLKEALPYLEKHFDWLATERCFGNSPLASILSPWESGLDHKPGFDKLMGSLARAPFGRYLALYLSEMRLVRTGFDQAEIAKRGYFNVREVLFNTVYALGLEALAGLLEAAGDNTKAERFRARGELVEAALLEDCFNPASGLYYDIDVRTGSQVLVPSVSCLMPIALRSIPENRRRALVSGLTDPKAFWPRYPVPSVPLNSRHFQPRSRLYLWRGPTWINTNWFLCEGLRRHGYHDLADEIARSSRELVELSGFREYYNPLTGEGGGEKDFGWSTLAAVM
jgi:glycogen debranching enzyme